MPVWNLLGGQVRERVRIDAHANTPEVALEVAAPHVLAAIPNARFLERIEDDWKAARRP